MRRQLSNREKRQRAFERQNGRCHHCRCKMILRERPRNASPLPNEATLEHLDDRYSQHRGTHPGKRRVVAACWTCNNKRGQKRDAERPLEELWWRSGRPKQETPET